MIKILTNEGDIITIVEDGGGYERYGPMNCSLNIVWGYLFRYLDMKYEYGEYSKLSDKFQDFFRSDAKEMSFYLPNGIATFYRDIGDLC